MILHTVVDGHGHRVAVLIHGLMSDHRAWDRLAADLVARGFRVIRVDLAGHGRSPRSRRYSPESWARDVVESVRPYLTDGSIDLLVGHSLGGLVASLVAERLGARAIAYADPVFALPGGIRGVVMRIGVVAIARPPRAMLKRGNPRWSDDDLDLEVETRRLWDRATAFGLSDSRRIAAPLALTAPTLLLLPERSLLVTESLAADLRSLGATVRVLANTSHTLFRDDYASFARAIETWLDTLDRPRTGKG